MSDLISWMAPWSGRVVTLAGMLLGMGIFIYALFLHDRSRGRPRCPKCWYNLTGLVSGRCPECGRDVTNTRHHFRTRRLWKVALAALLLGAVLPAITVHRRVQRYGWKYYGWMPPLVWVLPDRVRTSYEMGKYRIEIRQDRRPYLPIEQTLHVLRDGRTDIVLRGHAWHIEEGLAVQTESGRIDGGPRLLATEFGYGKGERPQTTIELGVVRATVIERKWVPAG